MVVFVVNIKKKLAPYASTIQYCIMMTHPKLVMRRSGFGENTLRLVPLGPSSLPTEVASMTEDL